jgi:hypothetical protein
MIRTTTVLAAGVFALVLLAANASASYILEIDTDGTDDGVLTYNSLFGFGGDTTTASQSAPSVAFGMTGGDSIFGGDGVNSPDTYVYSYDPGVDGDNLALAPGQDLGNGNFASGAVAGGPGLYNIYATWPFTTNVSGGLTNYEISTFGVPNVNVSLDQNNLGDSWILLGQIQYTTGAIQVTQTSTSNTFVSMRAAGLLFEPDSDAAVPEPSTVLLVGAGLGLLLLRRRPTT